MILLLLTTLLILIIYSVYLSQMYTFKFNKKNQELKLYDMPYVRYEAIVKNVNIENEYDCNVKNLKLCKTDDESMLFGCRELLVKCVHFDKDMEFEGGDIIVPKNNYANEGYALVVDNVRMACNPFHGDLVLISSSNESKNYRFVCKCKYDGYIGNDTLNGSCTTVHICNGLIDNIDQPLSKINCTCKLYETNIRYLDLVPPCKTLTIREANKLYNDWYHLVPFDSSHHLI